MRTIVSENYAARIVGTKQISQGLARSLDNTSCGHGHAVTRSAGIAARLAKILVHGGADSRRFGPGCRGVVKIDHRASTAPTVRAIVRHSRVVAAIAAFAINRCIAPSRAGSDPESRVAQSVPRGIQ